MPEFLIHAPPSCSPVIRLKRSIGDEELPQMLTLPSVPAVGWDDIFTVAVLKSSIHGRVPLNVYLKVLIDAPIAGMKVPAVASKVPPVPPVRDHVPPLCSPVIKLKRLMAAVLLSQTVVFPSLPASSWALMVTVAMLLSGMQGAVPASVYSKVLVADPAEGVKVPKAALKVPPVPVSLVQVPPACSPVIRLKRFIAVEEFPQILTPPSVPATGWAFIVTV
ncbi:MAG TPA: hypothetical protein VGB67_15970, partial [Fibrella sp.]